MAFPAVTAVSTVVLTLLFIVLTIRVSILRQADGLPLGSGDNIRLRRAVRAQGNLSENLPLSLILIGLLEYSGIPALLTGGLALLYIAARLSHAAGISAGDPFEGFRTAGAAGTLICLLAGGILLAHRTVASL